MNKQGEVKAMYKYSLISCIGSRVPRGERRMCPGHVVWFLFASSHLLLHKSTRHWVCQNIKRWFAFSRPRFQSALYTSPRAPTIPQAILAREVIPFSELSRLRQINAKLLCLPFVFFLAFLLFQYRAHSSSRALIAFLCVRCRNFSLFLGPLGQNRNKTRRSRSERRKEIRRNGTRKERHFARRDRDIRAVNFLGRPRGAD